MRAPRRFGRSTAAFLVGVVVLVAAFLSARPSSMTVDGHVYTGLDHRGRYFGPVSGAVVSNDRGSSTAVTDLEGYFRITMPHVGADEFVCFTVRSDRTTLTSERRMLWHPRVSIALLVETPHPRPRGCS